MSRDVAYAHHQVIDHVTNVMNRITEMFRASRNATVLRNFDCGLIVYAKADGAV